MTDLRKAAEMALDALIWTTGSGDFGDGGQAREGALKCLFPAIDELRQALAQEEKPPVKSYCGGKPNYCTPVDAVNISQERVDETAKGEHEPYGYVWTSLRDGMEVRFSRMPPNKFYSPQDIKPVYTAPPKREWVGLTEEEMSALKQKSVDDGMTRLVSDFEYIRSIEAKLKEKNSGS